MLLFELTRPSLRARVDKQLEEYHDFVRQGWLGLFRFIAGPVVARGLRVVSLAVNESSGTELSVIASREERI
jgi:hypothetical protein